MSDKETVKKYTETLIQMTNDFCDQHLDVVAQNQQANQPDWRSGSLRIPFSTWKQT